MVVAVPANYDVAKEQNLDTIERTVRDTPGINLNNWGIFRIAIHTGTERRSLHFAQNNNGNPLSPVPTNQVEDAYTETGKAHHEVIRSLYFAGLAHDEAVNQHSSLFLNGQLVFPPYGFFHKAVKDFYFHSGCFFDNLSRLIFILNDPSAVRQANKRRRINWGQITAMDNSASPPIREHSYANNYINPSNENQLEGIKNVRNLLTHSWKLPERSSNNNLEWPQTVRTDDNFPWWHEDQQFWSDVNNGTIGVISIIQAVRGDYQFLRLYQADAFNQLTRDISIFESSFSVDIRDTLRP